MTVIIILVTYSFFPVNSAYTDQADEFKAEGLTKPVVVPDDQEFAVKITFPQADFYMLFDPPQVAGYFTPEGIGFSNEWAETKSPADDGDDYGEVGFDRNVVIWIDR